MSEAKQVFHVKTGLEKIKEILSLRKDFEKFHPLVYSCQLQKDSKDEYLIKEQPFSWLPIKIDYDAIVNIENSNISYRINRIPFHKVSISYKISEEGSELTLVDCRIKINGPPVISYVLLRKMKAAQNGLFLNINDAFSANIQS